MIETRVLNGQVIEGVTVLDAIGDAEGLRVFFAAGTDPNQIGRQGKVVPQQAIIHGRARLDGGPQWRDT